MIDLVALRVTPRQPAGASRIRRREASLNAAPFLQSLAA
jgi:hypothetical protein